MQETLCLGREKGSEDHSLSILSSSVVVPECFGAALLLIQLSSMTPAWPAVLMGICAQHCQALGGVSQAWLGVRWERNRVRAMGNAQDMAQLMARESPCLRKT